MSHVACSHFRANFWRPTICAYCYCPKGRHSPRKTEGDSRRSSSFGGAAQLRVNVRTRRIADASNNSETSEVEGVPRCATISE